MTICNIILTKIYTYTKKIREKNSWFCKLMFTALLLLVVPVELLFGVLVNGGNLPAFIEEN